MGTIGIIHDKSGVFSYITMDHYKAIGYTRAAYLDSHGYGTKEIATIILAFESSTFEEFVGRAGGCGMSIAELEWFWCLEELAC